MQACIPLIYIRSTRPSAYRQWFIHCLLSNDNPTIYTTLTSGADTGFRKWVVQLTVAYLGLTFDKFICTRGASMSFPSSTSLGSVPEPMIFQGPIASFVIAKLCRPAIEKYSRPWVTWPPGWPVDQSHVTSCWPVLHKVMLWTWSNHAWDGRSIQSGLNTTDSPQHHNQIPEEASSSDINGPSSSHNMHTSWP